MRKFTPLILFLLSGFYCSAQQPIFVGVMAGHNYGQVMNIFGRPLKPEGKLGLFALNVFEFYWDDPENYTGRAQYHLTYQLSKSFQIGAGPNFVPMVSPRPSVSITYTKPMKSGTFVGQANADVWANGTFGLFAFYEFSPQSEKKINPYLRLQFVSDWTINGHSRSYQFIMAGIGLGNLRFGPAAHFNQFSNSKNYFENTNYGAFMNYLIF
jgi:hypothetical protein